MGEISSHFKGVEAIMNGWRAAGIAEIVKQSRFGIVQELNPFFLDCLWLVYDKKNYVQKKR